MSQTWGPHRCRGFACGERQTRDARRRRTKSHQGTLIGGWHTAPWPDAGANRVAPGCLPTSGRGTTDVHQDDWTLYALGCSPGFSRASLYGRHKGDHHARPVPPCRRSPVGSGGRSRPRLRVDAEVRLTKALEGRVAGPAVDCIHLRQIQSSEIFEKSASLYKAGRTWYLNRPESGAALLDRGDILVTNTHSSQLCSIDTVRLLDSGSRFPSGSLGLGKFVPYTAPRH